MFSICWMQVSILSKWVSTEGLGGALAFTSTRGAGDGAAIGGAPVGVGDAEQFHQNTSSLCGTTGPIGVKE